MKFIDLFCGIGGFHQALCKNGHTCVFACDIDEHCKSVYKRNYNMDIHGDIKTIDVSIIPSFDILCAGFPCTTFSKSGKQLGFSDKIKGTLFFEICRIVEYHKPSYLILENVKNLKSHDNGNTWDIIYNNITKLGYYTYEDPLVLNSLQFEVPQNRERVIIICKHMDLGHLPPKPITPVKNYSGTIKSILETDYDEKYKITGKLKVVETIWNNFLQILIIHNINIPKYPIWTDWWDSDGENTSITKIDKKLTQLENKTNVRIRQEQFSKKYKNWIDKNRDFYQSNFELLNPWLVESRQNNLWHGAVRKFEWQAGDMLPTDSMFTILWTVRGSGIRVKRINYTPTLVAISHIPIYGPESRFLTPRESIRLQSFPDSFQLDSNDKVSYKQIGNSVNVKMIEYALYILIDT